MQQFETPRSNLPEAEENPTPADGTLPSGGGALTEDIIDEEEDASGLDEGPSKLIPLNDDKARRQSTKGRGDAIARETISSRRRSGGGSKRRKKADMKRLAEGGSLFLQA